MGVREQCTTFDAIMLLNYVFRGYMLNEDNQYDDDGRRLDEYPVAVAFNEDGSIEIGSRDTPVFQEFLERLKDKGVEVDFEGLIYGLPWCG
jgi:hypothetical protein